MNAEDIDHLFVNYKFDLIEFCCFNADRSNFVFDFLSRLWLDPLCVQNYAGLSVSSIYLFGSIRDTSCNRKAVNLRKVISLSSVKLHLKNASVL